jgi:hypothetical protein
LYAALSESPFSESKLVLADLFRDFRGAQILDVAASRAETSRGQVEAIMNALPPIDLYIPHPEHRRTWRPSAPIAVATLLDATSPLVAHLAGGGVVPIDRMSPAPTDIAVLLLGPAEAKNVRAVARDECEGDNSPGLARSECEPPGGGGGGGGNSVFVTRIVTHGVYDNGFAWETNEFEFRGVADSSNAQSPVVRCTEIGPNEDVDLRAWPYCNTLVVHHDDPSEGHRVDVKVVETDTFGDDIWSDFLTPPPGFQWHWPYLTWYDGYNVCCYQRSYALSEEPGPYVPFIEVKFTWPTEQ